MIKKEIFESSEITELPQSRFGDISSENISKCDAAEFWKGMFGSMEKESEYSMSEAELFDKTRDCLEDQFQFDFEISDEMKDILSGFEELNWQQLDTVEQEVLVEKLGELIGEELGLEEIPEIEFYDGPEGECGCYMERYNVIGINRNTMDDARELVDTIAHETRHAYQRFRADKLETEQDQLYKYGFEHYIAPEYDEYGYVVNYFDYQAQLIEAEARAFAKLFTGQEVT